MLCQLWLLWANESLLWSHLGQLTDGSGAQHLLPLYSAAARVVGVPPPSLPPPSFLPISCAASVAHRPAPGALAHAGIQEKKRPKVREVEFLKSVYSTPDIYIRQLFFHVCFHKFANIECVSQAVFKRSFDLRVYYWLLGPLFDFTMSVEEKK